MVLFRRRLPFMVRARRGRAFGTGWLIAAIGVAAAVLMAAAMALVTGLALVRIVPATVPAPVRGQESAGLHRLEALAPQPLVHADGE